LLEPKINLKSVSTYRTRLLHKFDLHSNADITGYAIRRELIDDHEPPFRFLESADIGAFSIRTIIGNKFGDTVFASLVQN
jgi:hypothetical protein